MTSTDTDTPSNTTRLLPLDLKNEQFQLNIEAFNTYHPNLAKKINQHTPIKFQICLNSDDSINIYDKAAESLLYPTSEQECQQYFEVIVNSIQFTVRPYTIHTYETPLSKELTEVLPLNAAMHNKLLESNHFLNKVSGGKDGKTINKKDWNFIPLLRVYGIGLGQPILLALQKYDVATMIINEPDFDLFYTSLYTTPWNLILSTFNSDPHRQYYLNIANTTSDISAEINFLTTHHPFYANFKASLFGSLDRDFKKIDNLSKQYDSNHCIEMAGGCYEDQATGFKNALKNIINKARFYKGGHLKYHHPVFLIGSGPSLDASIPYLTKNKDSIIIIACGSALSALIKNNITPDFHILQERFDNTELLLKYASVDDFKNITCIKLNVVSTESDHLYKDVFVLQKANDPGSTLLPSEQYPHSYNVNPTVTNTGVTFCSLLGAKKVFLLGLDYGSSEAFSNYHSKDTLVLADDAVDKNTQFITEGNNSEKVFTNEFFLYSKKITEYVTGSTRDTQWFNVGEGAKIAHTVAISTEQLPKSFKLTKNKTHDLNSVKTLFNHNYSVQPILDSINETHIPDSQDYLLSLLNCFETIPQTRRAMMTTLSIIVQAAEIGHQEDSYLPKKLFSLEFMSFLNNLYVLICISVSDDEAISVYKDSVNILKDHIELIYQDFLSITASINNPK